jgi:hypothetical protein
MGKNKKKRPTIGVDITEPKKVPRVSDPALGRPSWRIGRLDYDGPWCPKKIGDLQPVLQRLKSFETMSWHEMHTTGSHPIPVHSIIPEAQHRLEELHLDDTDDVYSLRINGAQRLWGIKQGDAFLALWWDPEHEVCPAPKKHT